MKLPGVIEIFKLGTYSVVLNDKGLSSSHDTAAADGQCILEFRCVAPPSVNFTSFVQCDESMGPVLAVEAPEYTQVRELDG